MDFMILAFIFIFGLIIGSFLNVVILRYGSKDSIVSGSSKCPKCGKDLHWYELIPILSWVFQLGKCRNCKARISVQYPLVELVTGVLFLMQYSFFFDPSKAWIPAFAGMTVGWIALSLLVVIFVYDLYYKIIPDVWSYSFGILGLIYMFLNYLGWGMSHLALTKWDLLAPIIFFVPFWLLWRVSSGAWIGLGDGKLAFGIGGFLGLIHGLSAIVLSFWIGAIFAIGLMLMDRLRSNSKNITMKTEVAFGPFMIIAFLVVYFFGFDVTGISSFFNVF